MTENSDSTTPRYANDHVVTAEEMAEIEFEANAHRSGEWQPPTNNEWFAMANPDLVNLRLAWQFAFKSKAEMVEAVRGLGDDKAADLLGSMTETREHFKIMLDFLESGEARLACACAVRELELDAGTPEPH